MENDDDNDDDDVDAIEVDEGKMELPVSIRCGKLLMHLQSILGNIHALNDKKKIFFHSAMMNC